MRVDTYKNLNRECISVKCLVPGSDRYGIVISHEPKVHLRDVEFVIHESSQQRARESEKRNVHAFARGQWDERVNIIDGEPVTYNPFRFDNFVHEQTHWPVESAESAAVTTNGIFATGLSYGEP